MAILAPSLLSADFTRLGEQIEILKEKGVKYLHYDVMDGMFVPNISIGVPVLKSIRGVTEQVLDVHLMITEPERYIKAFSDAGVDVINIHYEATKQHKEIFKQIRELGKSPAITIKPKTSWEEIVPYLDMVDMVLVMSVEPGFGGQSFIEASLDNVRGLAQYRKEKGLDYLIEIDGGISLDNITRVINDGVDIVVAGSSVFSKGDLSEQTDKFLALTGEK
jgi:ribulose-phosphate 3-epimerase